VCYQSYFCLLDSVLCVITHTVDYWTSFTVTHVIFFIIQCGIVRFLCAMCVFDIRASSSHCGYLCAKFRLSHPPIAELARGEKLRTKWVNHSLTQSLTQLIWCPENRSFCFGNSCYITHLMCTNFTQTYHSIMCEN